MEQTDPEALANWVHSYVAEAGNEANVDAFVAQVDAAILDQTPQLAADPVLTAELHASTKAQFVVFLSLLERERQELLLPPQAVDLAMSIARRQLELGVLLKVYRVAAAAVWDFFTRVAADVPESGPDRTDVLIYLWDHGGTWINEAIEQLIAVFHTERDARLHGAFARRSETVHSILRGESVSIDAASEDLGHPLRGAQTALVIWSDADTSPEVSMALNEVAGAISAAAGGSALTVPAGRGELWCWLATGKPPELDLLQAALNVRATDPVVHVAVGMTAPGMDGFRASHREAIDAQRHATSVAEHQSITRYADVELACVAAGNPSAARTLVDREIGALTGGARGSDRLRETVATYLETGGNVEQTATRLILHKNTVRYRLGQAEELIGHPLTERRTEIALALACYERFAAES